MRRFALTQQPDYDAEVTLDHLRDFGLNHPFETVFRLFLPYYFSNYTALPKPGGLLEQDELLMDDLNTLSTLTSYFMRAARLKIAAPPVAQGEMHEQRLPVSNAPSFWDSE